MSQVLLSLVLFPCKGPCCPGLAAQEDAQDTLEKAAFLTSEAPSGWGVVHRTRGGTKQSSHGTKAILLGWPHPQQKCHLTGETGFAQLTNPGAWPIPASGVGEVTGKVVSGDKKMCA